MEEINASSAAIAPLGRRPSRAEEVVNFILRTSSRALQPRSSCPPSPDREQLMEDEER